MNTSNQPTTSGNANSISESVDDKSLSTPTQPIPTVSKSSSSSSSMIRQRRRKRHNLMPATIKQLFECEGNKFKVLDTEAEMIIIVGLVKEVKLWPNRTIVVMDDQTSEMECIYYNGSDYTKPLCHTPVKGTYGRVYGMLRTNPMCSKYMVIYNYTPVTDMNELTCHILKVIHLPMKLKQLIENEHITKMHRVQHTDDKYHANFLSNAMPVQPTSSTSTSVATENNPPEYETNKKAVLELIESCARKDGIHKNEILRNLEIELSNNDLLVIIEELTSEGVICKTINDFQYKKKTE